MKKFSKIAVLLLSLVLILDGAYRIYKGLFGDNNDKTTTSVAIGEWISDKDGVEFCVTNVDNVKSVGRDYFEISTDANFSVVTIKISNNGDEPYDVNALRFLLMIGDAEYEYATETVLSFDNYLSLDTINPGLSKEYVIVYETPLLTDKSECKLKIKYNAFSNENCVYIELN